MGRGGEKRGRNRGYGIEKAVTKRCRRLEYPLSIAPREHFQDRQEKALWRLGDISKATRKPLDGLRPRRPDEIEMESFNSTRVYFNVYFTSHIPVLLKEW